jgi:nitroreductase
MDLGEAIRRRRMCRDFSDAPVPREVVEHLIDRARRAPSAGHSQGWAFLVVTETERFWAVTSDPEWLQSDLGAGLQRAPLIVVPLCSSAVYVARYSEPDKIEHGLTTEEAWPVPFWTVDVSFATMLLLLGVVEEGLGALFFGFQTREAIDAFRAAFGVPDTWSPIGAVAVGWPSPAGTGPAGSATRGRLGVEQVIRWDRW